MVRVCWRARRRKRSWPRSGLRCWGAMWSACTTTSSSWAGTRCWRRKSSHACVMHSGGKSRCAAFSSTRRWRAGSGHRAAAARRGRSCKRRRWSGVTRAERLPLSFAQQRLWFLDQLEPGSRSTTSRQRCVCVGVLNVAALERTFSEVVRRHEVLRTHFSPSMANRCRSSKRRRRWMLPVIDLSALGEAERRQKPSG